MLDCHMSRRIKTVVAKDAEGKEYSVAVWQSMVDISRDLEIVEGKRKYVPGMKSCTLEVGLGVIGPEVMNYGDGRLLVRIDGNDVWLTSDDPILDDG